MSEKTKVQEERNKQLQANLVLVHKKLQRDMDVFREEFKVQQTNKQTNKQIKAQTHSQSIKPTITLTLWLKSSDK